MYCTRLYGTYVSRYLYTWATRVFGCPKRFYSATIAKRIGSLSLCPSIRSVFACIDTASAHRSLSLCLLAYILNCSKSKSSITRLDYIAIVCSRAEPASLRLIVPHLFPSHFFCFFFFFFSSSLVSWRDRSSGRLEIRQRHAIILWTVVVKGLLDQSILCCDDQSLLSFYFYF